MGKSEINPVIVPSDSESDSDRLDDKVVESSDDEEDVNIISREEENPRGRTRQRSEQPMVMMVAPWAPMPYLRRAWTPEPKKKYSNLYKRSQSVPEPSCSSAVTTKSAEPKAEKKTIAEKAVRRWTRWQMFMKYLTDEMCEDDSCVKSSTECAACDVKADSRERKVHFTGRLAIIPIMLATRVLRPNPFPAHAPYGTQFFRFRGHFHQKAAALEVNSP